MRSETAKSNPLDVFSDPVRRWFEASFAEPTPAQAMGWPKIAAGANTLICAPTGSGKTLAAFLWGIDRLSREPERLGQGVRIVYVSPLKALSYDIERNLRAPLKGIEAEISVGLRTGRHPAAGAPGDAPQAARHPDHHPGVALPDHDLGGTGDPHRRGGGDRRRDPRGCAVEARRAPGAHPGAALAPRSHLQPRRRAWLGPRRLRLPEEAAGVVLPMFNESASRPPSGRWSGSPASWPARAANARSPTPASPRSSTWRSSSRSRT